MRDFFLRLHSQWQGYGYVVLRVPSLRVLFAGKQIDAFLAVGHHVTEITGQANAFVCVRPRVVPEFLNRYLFAVRRLKINFVCEDGSPRL